MVVTALNQTLYKWKKTVSNQTPNFHKSDPNNELSIQCETKSSTQQANQTPVKHPTEVYYTHQWENSISTCQDTSLENHVSRPRLPTGTTPLPTLFTPDRPSGHCLLMRAHGHLVRERRAAWFPETEAIVWGTAPLCVSPCRSSPPRSLFLLKKPFISGGEREALGGTCSFSKTLLAFVFVSCQKCSPN